LSGTSPPEDERDGHHYYALRDAVQKRAEAEAELVEAVVEFSAQPTKRLSSGMDGTCGADSGQKRQPGDERESTSCQPRSPYTYLTPRPLS